MRKFKKLLNKLPYIKGLVRQLSIYKTWVPPGHFYSPVVSVEDVVKRKNQIFDNILKPSAIEINDNDQFKLLKSLLQYYSDMPFGYEQCDRHRFFFNNKYFAYADGTLLYLIMRHINPSKIIEIGSGFSSALMLDVNEIFLSSKSELSFIEPFPENRLTQLLRSNDSATLLAKPLQEIDLSYFDKLTKGDILFVDSSHVAKTGSDLNYLMFQVLPRLSSGIIIHFHDIFYPFEYPVEWVTEGRSWNEVYFIQAFLMYNTQYQVLLFNNYVQKKHKDWIENNMPLLSKDRGSSLWLMKV